MHHLSLTITEELALVQGTMQLAEEIYQLLDSDREHLGQFLDFVALTQTVADEERYLKMKLTGEVNGTDRLFLIAFRGEICGCIDLHGINQKMKKAELGYWLHSTYTGRGIMKQCVHKVCQIAFEGLELNKLGLVADVENHASNGIATACGFTLLGTEPQDIVLYGEFRDMNRYYLLKQDFR